jgi:two-component system heavy metal sensor histidine kinase CusS
MSSMCGIRLPDARRWSLTARMTIFFGTAIAVIVVCVSAMMYAELVHQLREKEEAELLEDLHVQQEVLNEMQGKTPPSRWQHEWREQQNEIGEFSWQLLATNGRALAGSGNAAVRPARAGPSGRFYRVTTLDDAARTFLLMDAPFSDAEGPKVLRGMLEVSQDERVLRRYLAKLICVMLLAIVSSVGLGWLLARRGLAPVRAISAEIGRMNAERLNARIAQEAWPAELGALAETFDELMARIERAFEQLSRFSSDLAHEFRSPINNLVAAASVTLGRARSAEEYQNTLEVVVAYGFEHAVSGACRQCQAAGQS